MLRPCLTAALFAACATASQAGGTDKTIAAPSDDRWHYPFNQTPGFRTTASLFVTPPNTGFDYRDAMMMIRWRPSQDSLAPDFIPSGLDPSEYEFDAVRITVHHATGTYTWDTRNPAVNFQGKPFVMEVFGFDVDSGVSFTEETWTEFSPFFGQSPFTPTGIRNPHPLNLQSTSPQPNATNLVDAQPWGFGEPVYGTDPGEYTPGVAATTPFPVTFTLDLSNIRVKRYIQEALAAGRLEFVLSSTAGPADPGGGPPGGAQTFVPVLTTKENTTAPAPSITFENLRFRNRDLSLVVSDDQWQYPFNATPGTRTSASLFTSPPGAGFDYRDGMMIVRWRIPADPSSPDHITPGLPPAAYRIEGATATLWHSSGSFNWDTRSPAINPFGEPFRLEVFGMGVLPGGSFTAETWTETTPISAATPFPPVRPRNPYPVGGNLANPTQNVSNTQGATVWGLGEPTYGVDSGEYFPGSAAPFPFPVEFDLDLSNPNILAYLQRGLSEGRIELVFASTAAAEQPARGTPPSGTPVFLMKESGTGQNAPQLLLRGVSIQEPLDSGWTLR
ncbi:MAG: hypothetical protein SF028_11295 [Candidatus Sumerlaeia bacterium]|nr:hypothetical protein [Candidatus Sumerlaeia bacterium]